MAEVVGAHEKCVEGRLVRVRARARARVRVRVRGRVRGRVRVRVRMRRGSPPSRAGTAAPTPRGTVAC